MSILKSQGKLLKVSDDSNSPLLEKNDVVFAVEEKRLTNRGFYIIKILGQATLVLVGKNKDGSIFFYKASQPKLKFSVTEDFFNSIVSHKIIWYARSLCENTPIADPLYDDEVNGHLYKKRGIFSWLFS